MTSQYIPPHKRDGGDRGLNTFAPPKDEADLNQRTQKAAMNPGYGYGAPQGQMMGFQQQQGGGQFGNGFQQYGGGFGGGFQQPYQGQRQYGGQNQYGGGQRQGYGGGQYNNYRGGGYGGYRGRGRGGRDNNEPRYSEYDNSIGVSGHKEANSEMQDKIFKKSCNQGIAFDEYDKVEVEVGNYENFEPAQSFEAMNLHPNLLRNVQLCGFRKPTPIQKYTIPVVMAQRDLMACAQTGSGKTAAFLLPLIQDLLTLPAPEIGFHSRRKCYPKAMIISPTRELAQQIHKDCVKFIYRTGLSTACIFGGSSVEKQLRTIKNYKIDILICTVGRLWDFFEREKISFEDVSYFILDEADRMLDMGFEKDILNILYRSDLKQENRTNLLFSATMPSEIQSMAAGFLTNYVFLACGRVGGVGNLITQNFEYIATYKKTERLVELLNEIEGRVLVFTATKRKADELEWELKGQNVRPVAIHGDKKQHAREKALHKFRTGRCNVMLATDVASRGLDIPDVKCVIQYDLPNEIDSYVHRIGRTGRCGNKGNAITFVNEKNKPILGALIDLLKKESVEIPDWLGGLHSKVRRSGYNGRGRGRRGKGRGGRNNYNQRGGNRRRY